MPKTDHPIEREELMAYLDGELPADRAGMAAGHLERCRECQDLAADLQAVSRRMMEWQVESAEPEISHALSAAFGRRGPRSRPKPWWTLGFASAAILVVLTSLALQKMGKLSPPTRSQLSFLTSPESKIARKAEINITTSDFDKARVVLEDIVKRHNGYFGQLTVNAPAKAARMLNASLRIPAIDRNAAIAEVKNIGRVVVESQSGEDVTSDYVDLEARLTNARNTEQRLTEVLRQRTGKLSDILEVEKEISRVRGDIERMEVEKKTFTTRVDFLTLEVTLTEERPVQSHNSFVDAAVAGYRRVTEGGANIIMFLLAYGPSLLLWFVILFFPARWAWKRFRRA